MNKFFSFAVALGILASPALSFAQSSTAPVTRAQVRAELVRLEQAGYNISAGEDAHYPADIQAAEAKIATDANAQQAAGGVGGVATGGRSEAGAPVRVAHAMQPACVGPAGFCTPYFGN